MGEALHFNQSSPLTLPLPFMLAAPVFGTLAMLLLLAGLPGIMESRWNPQLIAAVHLFTLGFLGSAMFGAISQIVPVLSGQPPLRNILLIRCMQVGLLGGVSLFAAGLISDHATPVRLAVGMLAISITILLLATVKRLGPVMKSARRPSVRGLVIALAGLMIAAGLGLRLLSGWGFEFIDIPRQLTDLHAGWAMFAWIAPLIFAIGLEVIPMFQFTRPLPDIIKHIPMALVTGMALTSFTATHGPGKIIIALALFTGAAVILERQWRRPHGRADGTLVLFRIGMLSLISSVLILALPESLFASSELRSIAAVFLFLVGGAGSAVIGMLLKVVPFLQRLHLQRLLWRADLPARTLPPFQKMLPAYADKWIWPLHLVGTVLSVTGLLATLVPLQAIGFTFVLGAFLLTGIGCWQITWQAKGILMHAGDKTHEERRFA